MTHDVIALRTNAPFGATVDREWAELTDTADIPNGDGCAMDAPDMDTPDREIDDREKPRANEPLDFFEYSDDGVGTGVEFGVGFEYNDLGVGAAFALDLGFLVYSADGAGAVPVFFVLQYSMPRSAGLGAL